MTLTVQEIPDLVAEAEVKIVMQDNLSKYLQHMISRRSVSSKHFTSLIFRKSFLELYHVNGNNTRNTASLLSTLCIASGAKEEVQQLEERWRSNIKYYIKNKCDVTTIDLEECIKHLLQNGEMKSDRNKDSGNVIRASAVPAAHQKA